MAPASGKGLPVHISQQQRASVLVSPPQQQRASVLVSTSQQQRASLLVSTSQQQRASVLVASLLVALRSLSYLPIHRTPTNSPGLLPYLGTITIGRASVQPVVQGIRLDGVAHA